MIEDINYIPKVGNTLEKMKKELRKMKVINIRDEPFRKESKINFVRDENIRSRYDDRRQDIRLNGYVRSDSHPDFFRTQFKSTT